MSIRKVSNCQGCGQSPCFECTTKIGICDECEDETETLYWDFDHELQLCPECMNAYIEETILPEQEIDIGAAEIDE